MSTAFTKPVWSLIITLIISCLLFLTLDSGLSITKFDADSWQFILGLRSKKLLALLIVGFAVGASTLLFQTITHNPILTPSLLGFDSLYILLQSLLVFSLGAVHFNNINPIFKFTLEVSLMFTASFLLFVLMFRRKKVDLAAIDLTRVILVGIIFGVLFRSFSALISRLMDPEEYITIQVASFAGFNSVNPQLMVISLLCCVFAAFLIWRWRNECDVLLLGKIQAVNLGVNYFGIVFRLLIIISLLVATATAFVGPVTFLGLLVCALTNKISRKMYHGERLLLVSLIAMTFLVLGQTIFEHVLGMAGILSVVIEFVGGIAFLVLIFGLNKAKKIV
ncbi:iron chelate uptake ABC transporter family permease subunit [Psychrobacter sp. HD31]|uniref:iron chelate uptake ABC transporter family permease subunit n=1 Tax=Psychrobacter sp. HD31 TaxID=3112003 RepID=UPI003DA344BF